MKLHSNKWSPKVNDPLTWIPFMTLSKSAGLFASRKSTIEPLITCTQRTSPQNSCKYLVHSSRKAVKVASVSPTTTSKSPLNRNSAVWSQKNNMLILCHGKRVLLQVIFNSNQDPELAPNTFVQLFKVGASPKQSLQPSEQKAQQWAS